MARFKKILQDPIQVFLLLIPFVFGLYYEFAAYLAGVLTAVLLLKKIIQEKKVVLPKTVSAVLMAMAYLGYVVVCFYAKDRGMAVAGCFKMLPILLFILLMAQYSKTYHKTLLEVLPYTAVIMVIIAAPLGLTEAFSKVFYSDGRLGGFFQYANTFALFLMVGTIVLLKRDRVFSKNEQITGTLLLSVGVLLTGSRTVTVLFIMMLLFHAITQKALRKEILFLLGVGTVVVLVVFMTTGKMENISRILSLGFGESTFVGRWIYYNDALHEIIKHPFGLGYMGYYYQQPIFQTAVYTVRYVHNDFLQVALDVGIVPALCLIGALLSSLLSKKTEGLQKEILLFVAMASVLDFHLQFIIMPMILVLCLDLETTLEFRKKSTQQGAMVTIAALGCMLGWLFVAFFMAYMNNMTIALSLFPWNTDAKVEQLHRAGSEEEANQIAESVLKNNLDIALAWEAKAIKAYRQQDFEEMMNCQKQMLSKAPYEIENYKKTIEMLSESIEICASKGNVESLKRCGEFLVEIPKLLDEVKERTNPLAWMIDDKPELELSKEYHLYIEEMKTFLSQYFFVDF